MRERVAATTDADYDRAGSAEARRAAQRERLRLPPFPTTTIGSFPQTPEIRRARRRHNSGAIDDAQYEGFLEQEIAEVIRLQEEIGLDVLVHGEAERNDMVEYFGEAARGLRLHALRLGAVLRLAQRQAADRLRRRLPARADDGALGELRAVANR